MGTAQELQSTSLKSCAGQHLTAHSLAMPWLWLTLMLGAVGGVIAYHLHNNYVATLQMAEERLTVGARSVAYEIERRIVSIDAALTDLSKDLPALTAAESKDGSLQKRLSTLKNAVDGVRTFAVFDAKGTVKAASRREVAGSNYRDRPYFQAARANTDPVILLVSRPFKTIMNVWTVVFAKSLLDNEGAKFQGLVTATFDPEGLAPTMSSPRHSSKVSVGLIHGSGSVVLYVTEAENFPYSDVSDPESFFSLHMKRNQEYSVHRGKTPVLPGERLAVAKSISPASVRMSEALVVVVSQELDDILHGWYHDAKLQALFFAMFSLCVCGGLLIYQGRQRTVMKLVAAHQAKQQRHEAELLKSRNFNASVLDSLVEHVAVIDAQGAIIAVNRAWREFAQRNNASEQTVSSLGLNYLEICASAEAHDFGDEAPQVMDGIRQVLARQQSYFGLEYPCHGPNEQRWFHMHVTPLQGGVTGAVIAHENITMRKMAEQEARDAQTVTQKFLDHLPGTAYVKDCSLRVVMANAGFQSLLGLDPLEMIGKTNEEIFPEPFGEKISQDDWRIISSGCGEVVIEQFEGRTFESHKFIITDESGQRLLGGITQEVTLRETQLARQRALLKLAELGGELPEREFLTQCLQEVEALTNSQIGFLHFVNDDQETIELVTWTAGALKGCSAVFDSHYPISHAGVWADCFRYKQPVVINDYERDVPKKALPDGHAPLRRMAAVPVIEEGRVRVIIGVGNKVMNYDDHDVASLQLIGNDAWRIVRRQRVERDLIARLEELKALNARLEEAQSQLLQSEKLASIGQLAAGIAHELNNPIGFVSSNLSSLGGYVDDLLSIDATYRQIEERLSPALEDAFEPARRIRKTLDHEFIISDVRQLLDESREGLDRVGKIVRDLKDFSRAGDGGWQYTDLHQGLESTLNIVWNEIKYKADITREYGDLPPVYCIPSQINQVFMNLLTNAAQSIPERGHIILRSGRVENCVWVEIQDDGSGIETGNLRRIFDPFFTTKPVGKGTGLGLSLSWGIVQRHRGTIEVDSSPGRGARFRVVLPIEKSAQIESEIAS